MKFSTLQILTIFCCLSIGFMTVAPFFQREAYGGADEFDCDAYEVRSFATGQVVGHRIVSGVPVNTSHYGYYHNPGSTTAAWAHYQTWPNGHGAALRLNIIGTIWV